MFLKVGKKSSQCWFDWEQNSEKGWGDGKRYSWVTESGISVLVWEREKNNSEITVVILRYKKFWSLLFEKDFKIPEFLLKHPFFYFRDHPKNGEGNKQMRRRKYMRKSN